MTTLEEAKREILKKYSPPNIDDAVKLLKLQGKNKVSELFDLLEGLRHEWAQRKSSFDDGCE